MMKGLELSEEEIDKRVGVAKDAVLDAVSKMSKPNISYDAEAQLDEILRLGPIDDGPNLVLGRCQQQEVRACI